VFVCGRNLDLPPHLVNVGRLDFNSEGLLLFTNNGALARALEHPKGAKPIHNLCVVGALFGLFLPSTLNATTPLTPIPPNWCAGGIPREYRVRMHSAGRLKIATAGSLEWEAQEVVQRLAAGLQVKGVPYGPIRIRPCSGEGEQAPSKTEGGEDYLKTPANRWYEVTLQEGKNRELRKVFEHLEMPVSRIRRVGFGPLRLGTLPRGDLHECSRKEIARLVAGLKDGADFEGVLEELGTQLGSPLEC